jgi:hypothetical protein
MNKWHPGISTLLLISILFIGYLTSHHKNAIEKRYGFCIMTPEIKWMNCHIEPIMVRCIKDGGAFDKAGFMDRDILVSPSFNSVNALLKSLNQPKGTVLLFGVIPFEDFRPECESDKRGTPVIRTVVAP